MDKFYPGAKHYIVPEESSKLMVEETPRES